jgi:serine/threonine-protein kinase
MYYESEGRRDPVLIDYPKGGYVPVFRRRQRIETEEPGNHRSFWPPRSWVLIGVALLVLLTLFGVLRTFFVLGKKQPLQSVLGPQIQIYRGAGSVAVLPFLNNSVTPETENFSGWLAEELVNVSNRVGTLGTAPDGVVPPGDSAADILSVGARLGVDNVLQGSIRGVDGRLQVSVKLVSVKNGYHLWSDLYDCAPGDIIVIQHLIAREVVNALRSKPETVNQKPESVSLPAYNLYVDGVFQMRRGGDLRLLVAKDCFEKSIAEDPAFGLVYSGLAAAYVRLIKWNIIPPQHRLAETQLIAERALELHEHLPQAYTLLAVVNSMKWQWKTASQDFAMALRNDPSSGELREAYAITYLLPMGRLDEAREQIRQAALLDPLAPSISVNEGLVLYCQKEYESAIDKCRKALVLQPGLIGAHLGLASALAEQSRFKEAMAAIESLKDPADDPMMVAMSGYLSGISATSRDTGAALSRLSAVSDHKSVPNYYKSLVYLGMGNTGLAIRCLEQAYVGREPSLIYLGVDPKWSRLRSHTGFKALLSKIGLPE